MLNYGNYSVKPILEIVHRIGWVNDQKEEEYNRSGRLEENSSFFHASVFAETKMLSSLKRRLDEFCSKSIYDFDNS